MTEFYKLPESMNSEELQNRFDEFFLCYSNNTTESNIIYALEELMELADRQWHTYNLIDDKYKIKVEQYLESIIIFENEEVMELILCIIPRLGLRGLFLYILERQDFIMNENVRRDIIESKIEYGDSVANPYSNV